MAHPTDLMGTLICTVGVNSWMTIRVQVSTFAQVCQVHDAMTSATERQQRKGWLQVEG